jgi:hypothetical protein
VGEDGGLIAGHARVLAARQLGIAEIPVMVAVINPVGRVGDHKVRRDATVSDKSKPLSFNSPSSRRISSGSHPEPVIASWLSATT